MASEGSVAQLRRALHSAHFWLILAMLVALGILHYIEQLGLGTEPSTHLGLTRHAVDRVLFLLPIIYAGYVFRLRAGLATCVIAFLIMLPRVLFISPAPFDASIEIAGVLIVGTLACLWLEAQLKRKEERQKAEAELETTQQELQSYVRLSRSNEKRLATLNAVSTLLSRSLEPEQVIRSGLDMVMEVMEVEAALIFSLDERAQELRLLAYEGVSEGLASNVDRMKLGEGFNGRVALTGEPLIVEDASHDPRLTRQMVKQERIEAQLIVPLRARGLIRGTLCVANRRPRQFLPEEVELLTAIGGQIGIALENARLYQEQQQMAGQYWGLFANASDAIWVHDLRGKILTANEAAARLTGYSVEELVQMNVVQLLSKEALDLAGEVRRKLFQRDFIDEPYEQRLIRKDGTEALLKLTSSLVLSDGQPVAFQHIARDATEEQRIQENLRFYVQEVTKAQEEERKRIARELHDEAAQGLVALSHQLEDFARNNEHLSQDDIKTLENLRKQARDVLQGVRSFSRDLRPSILDDLGLLPALEWLATDLTETFGITTEVALSGTHRRLSPEVELLLFRIVQEALRNVWKHSEASKAKIEVEFKEKGIILKVSDNGKGFKLPERVGDLAAIGKLGLIGMQERARLLGASLSLQSEPEKGTTITVEALA